MTKSNQFLKTTSKKGLILGISITLLFLMGSCSKEGSNENQTDVQENSTEEGQSQNNSFELELQSEFANTQDYTVATDGIFAIWWENGFDYEEDAVFMLQTLNNIRKDCLEDLGMQDPPNVEKGVFFNVYIHHNEGDNFPNGWANGVGTNQYDLPYMTLPSGAHMEFNNLLHEGFHVFQYQSNSPGFEYLGDSAWYIESTAQWFAVTRNPGTPNLFVEIGAITSNPHLALWHSFDNEAPGDPTDWLYQVRQYALQAWLFYMTNEENVDQDLISDGFYKGLIQTPQEYHFQSIGADRTREIFANWAARNTLDFDYLTREQVARAKVELNNVADLDNRRPYAIALDQNNFLGTHSPPDVLKPRSWAYNVVKLEELPLGSYNITLTGEAIGSEGAESHFEGRFVIKGSSAVQSFDMISATEGTIELTLSEGIEEAYIIISSVPEHFNGYQNYGYSLTIAER